MVKIPSAPAIIVAAGAGVRMNASVRKQYMLLHDRPILAHTLAVFEKCEAISRIYLVVPKHEFGLIRETILIHCCQSKEIILVEGGKVRQESVFNGLGAIDGHEKYLVVHDGVRPMVSPRMIEECLRGAVEYGACIMGLAARETIKLVDDDRFIQKTLKRDMLWLAQTPQAFECDILREAHHKAAAENYHGTDDASLVERMGIKVKVIPGTSFNIKITTPEDLFLARHITAGS